MLVQMLTDRVAQGGSYNLTFGESVFWLCLWS